MSDLDEILRWYENNYKVPMMAIQRVENARKEIAALRVDIAQLRAAKPNTNEFYANGLRVGKRVGFNLGVEAAKQAIGEWIHEDRYKNLLDKLTAITKPTEEGP
jgi:flagellar biosynthesis/type III secretory pathway protein FliH